MTKDLRKKAIVNASIIVITSAAPAAAAPLGDGRPSFRRPPGNSITPTRRQ